MSMKVLSVTQQTKQMTCLGWK